MRRIRIGTWIVAVTASLALFATAGLAASLSSIAQVPTGQVNVAPDEETGIDEDTEVDIQRRFNELRREILDDRADAIGWWLSGIALFLSVLVLLIAVAGYLGFRKLREIEEEARRNVEVARMHAEEAFKFVEEIRGYGGETDERLRSITSANVEFARVQIGEDSTRDPGRAGASAIADARLLEEDGRLDEARERWRHIASVAEGTNDELAALAYRSIGDLSERLSRSNRP
jgi:ABC-type multidrug transport system fused ATPase/permease subunit